MWNVANIEFRTVSLTLWIIDDVNVEKTQKRNEYSDKISWNQYLVFMYACTVFILDGHLEIGAQLRSNLFIWSG